MNARLRVAGICLALSVMAGLVLLVVRPSLNPAHIRPLPLIAAAWMAFLIAAWLLRKVPLRAAVPLILLGGIAVQVAAVSAPPQNSDDLYRYIWDGRVQAAGIDPYAYVPAARQLTGLRDELLWHPGATYCVKPAYVAGHPAAELAAGCTAINRPTVPTIYPPVAEAYFLGVHYLPGSDDSTTPIQAATALAAVLITVLLLFGLRRLGRDMRMAALWAWCPTVPLEAGNSAHVDVIAVGICAAALLVLATARTTRRTMLGGVLLGLAIATKVTPVLTVPAVLARGDDPAGSAARGGGPRPPRPGIKRRWVTVLAAAGSAFIVVYVPHVIAVGSKVIGYLPGYLKEEGYTSGTRFALIGLFVGGRAAIATAVLVLALVALAVLRYSDPDQPWRGAIVMTAAALAVTTPPWQWYALLLVMLVALDGRPEFLAFAAGGYYASEPDMGRLTVPYQYHDAFAYGVPVLIVLAGWLVRRELARRGTAGTEPLPVTAGAAVTDGAAPDPEADRVGAFLPLGYPWGKHQTAPTAWTVNEDMSYDPPHHTPPRQERWPHATPQEGWPSYLGGYAGAANGYAGAAGGYPGAGAGYAGAAEADPGGADGFDGGYGADDYPAGGTSYRWDGNEYEYQYRGAGPQLIAPDTIAERGWLANRDEEPGRHQDRGGLIIGAVTGLLAAAVAIGVATLAAAFVRPQASPIIAVGGAFIDRTPPALKNFAVEHFGENDKTILLLGMYVTIACIAMVIGCLARRNVTIGVAGLAAFGLFGAFVAITRPDSRATDVLPSVIGAIAGIAALLWLARAAAPIAPARAAAPTRASAATPGSRHARGSRRRGPW
jgi:hypothetical protein